MATGIAIYAALVGTGSLGWQVVQWVLARRVRLTVAASLAIMTQPRGSVSVVAITVVNRSDFPVRISNVGIDTQYDSGRSLHLTTPMPGATIPGTIPPHDSASAYIPRLNVEREGINLYHPVRVWARDGAGSIVRSSPSPLIRRDDEAPEPSAGP